MVPLNPHYIVYLLVQVIGLIPFECAAVYFGTTISDLGQFKEISTLSI
jgi:hypothetical protein